MYIVADSNKIAALTNTIVITSADIVPNMIIGNVEINAHAMPK